MWTVWSHNLSNMFIAPVSVSEYLVAYIGAAFIKTFAVVGVLSAGAWWAFDFNLLDVGLLNLALFVFNLALFGAWLGVVILGLIFRFGTRIQSLSWGLMILFQPLVASFFPVSMLPPFFQVIAFSLPGTYVFEAARQALGNGAVDWQYAGIALGLNLLYLVVSLVAFDRLFRRSKESGQFARNDA
jgi:ABC-2 type transport system permease protein